MCGMVESEARKRRMRKEQSKNYVNGFLSKSCIYLSVTSFYRFVGHFSKLPFAISRWQRFKMFHLFVILYLRLKNRINCYFKSCYVGLITKKINLLLFIYLLIVVKFLRYILFHIRKRPSGIISPLRYTH